MKDKSHVWNPLRMLSPMLNSEIGKLDQATDIPADASKSPDEILAIMLGKVIELTKMIAVGVKSQSEPKVDICERLILEIEQLERILTKELVKESETFGQNVLKAVVRLPSRVERMGAMFEHILSCLKIKTQEGIPFSDKAQAELNELFAVTVDLLNNLRDALLTCNGVILEHIKSQTIKVSELAEEARFNHWERLERGFCSPDASAIYLKILDSFKQISEYCAKITDSLCSLGDTIS
ncbi:MAG: hypothetical protein ACP5VS_13970 [Desulfomonilaceae bacterium]